MYIILLSFLRQHICFMCIHRDLSGVKFLFQDYKILKHAGIRNPYRNYSPAVKRQVVDTVGLGHSSGYREFQNQPYWIRWGWRMPEEAKSGPEPSLEPAGWGEVTSYLDPDDGRTGLSFDITQLNAFFSNKTEVHDLWEILQEENWWWDSQNSCP